MADSDSSDPVGSYLRNCTILEEVENLDPTDEEVRMYAWDIGIDPDKEADLLHIAREGLSAPVPKGWIVLQNRKGSVFYQQKCSGICIWEHPLDAQFRLRVVEAKSKKSSGQNDFTRCFAPKKSSDLADGAVNYPHNDANADWTPSITNKLANHLFRQLITSLVIWITYQMVNFIFHRKSIFIVVWESSAIVKKLRKRICKKRKYQRFLEIRFTFFREVPQLCEWVIISVFQTLINFNTTDFVQIISSSKLQTYSFLSKRSDDHLWKKTAHFSSCCFPIKVAILKLFLVISASRFVAIPSLNLIQMSFYMKRVQNKPNWII
ncbi:Centrosomal protein [Echinococcus granulosus]|uniref:Centrosomal protein n=1 Tax=Echinococcus granulosus TaxID=6210 RepID=W6V0W7_ECHGR|nr:Centrosomal protein [Echinococcus granulosus]EUB59444.1 Centrosomal protein [Echinococcus granulosus]